MKTMLLSCTFLLFALVLTESSLYANDPKPERPKLVFLESEWEALLQPQAGCPLPCWWGIEPGKTLYFQSGQVYLRYIESLIQRNLSPWYEDSPRTLYIQHPQHSDYPVRLMDIGRIPKNFLSVDYVTLDFGEIIPEDRGVASYFLLTNLVAQYGLPDCVYVDAARWVDDAGFGQAILSSLGVCWQNLDMAVIYELAWDDKSIGPSCLSMEAVFGLEIYLLPPRDFFTESLVSEARLWFGPVNPVGEVLTIDQDTFIQMLVDGQNCLSIEQLLTIVK
jgi:hypothetical protein